MLISTNQKIHKNCVSLIAIVIAIGSSCLPVQATLSDPAPFKNNDLVLNDETEGNANSNQVDNNVHIPLDVVESDGSEALSQYVNVSKYPGERCTRVCVRGQKRICYFEFTLEHYQSMGLACGNCSQGVENDCKHPQCIVADGVAKGVMSINRQIPGPALHVCKDDLVIVDVHNQAQGSAATLHWHGIHMKGTPHMDGVPFVTQCPIPFTNTFRYKFIATNAGTQFYHSHSGHHKMNGQYGALIVREPGQTYSDLPEHYILISDWMHVYAEDLFPGILGRGINPTSVLINGRGVYTNPETGERTKVNPTIYKVKAGQRYRFRIINAVSLTCPYQLQIENHHLLVVASDSFDVYPYVVNTLVSNAGERYDIIVETNHTGGDFWIRIRGMGFCSFLPIESYALLRYEPSDDSKQIPPFPAYNQEYPNGIILNHPLAKCWGGENDHCVTELTSTEHDGNLRNAVPDHEFYLSFKNHLMTKEEVFQPGQYQHFSNVNNILLVGAINNISVTFPDFPPLTQPDLIDETKICNSFNKPEKCAGRQVCSCTHVLKVPLNSVVDFIIVDETKTVGSIHHPFHLHGYRFMVMGLGQHPYGLPMTIERAKQLGESGLLRNDISSTNPPFKDTVTIPSTGYAVARINATNPGFWMLHCHYEWHLTTGMGLLLQVGETSEMVKAPKNFPKCGNYAPRVYL